MPLSRSEISRRARQRGQAGVRLYRVALTAPDLWALADAQCFPDDLLADSSAVERELTAFVRAMLKSSPDRYR